jgi:hypothetical protein
VRKHTRAAFVLLILSSRAAFAQANTDPGTIGQQIITTLGGASGGYILAAALLVTGLLIAIHMMPPRAFGIVFVIGALTWGAAYFVRTYIGWA